MKKIYSFKATGGGCRVCATDMKDATKQVYEAIKGYGPMNCNVTELKNQDTAMKQWLEKGNKA